ncbi:MAG: hypothetical protein V4538_06405 [Bacteroidota bacterium]
MIKSGGKQLILTICIIGFIGCRNTEQKTETAQEAKERVIQAMRNSQEPHSDSLDEYILYTTEMGVQLHENELKIASFKTIIKLETQATQDKFEKQIEQIETQNTQLKTILNQRKVEERDTWIAFKTNFNKQIASINLLIAKMNEDFIFNTSPYGKKQ